MKYPHRYAWLLLFTFGSSYAQDQADAPTKRLNSETRLKVTSPNSTQNYVYSKYEYPDSTGAALTIHNSLPKSGIRYTGPDGEKFVYAVFWTRITNNTAKPFELKINFPLDSFEVPTSSANHIKLLLPPDIMTIDKEPKFDYGLAVKSFLDQGINKSSSLTRTINPNESSGFYVLTLANRGVNGTLRTELYIKDQSLFYKINDKEIHCGMID
jgi:hypothetical protein